MPGTYMSTPNLETGADISTARRGRTTRGTLFLKSAARSRNLSAYRRLRGDSDVVLELLVESDTLLACTAVSMLRARRTNTTNGASTSPST